MAERKVNVPSHHNKKKNEEERLCKIKTEAFYLQECWWTWNEGRSPALKLNAPDALRTQWATLEFLLITYIFPSVVSVRNLIFRMSDTFRISDETMKKKGKENTTHAADTQTPQWHQPRLNPSPRRGGKKKEKDENETHSRKIKMQTMKKSCWHLVTFLFHFYV